MDNYRIGIVSEPILGVSYRILSATFVSADITCNAAGSVAVKGLHYTGGQRVVATRHPPHERRWSTTIREGVEGAEVQMLTVTLQLLIRPTCHTPALQPTHQTTEQTAEPSAILVHF